MSDKTGLRCMYAEMLNHKKVTLKVASVRDAPELLYCSGQSTGAWDVIFTQKDKEGRTLYVQIPMQNKHGKSTAILRQYIMVMGAEPSEKDVGKDITLYTIDSKKSVTGQAIRIAIPEQAA